eukprot:Em0001g1930a
MQSHLTLEQILEVTFLWTEDMPRETVRKWIETEKIGGVGKVVEIDESKFGKRKYNRGRRREGQWVLGGVERGSDEVFMHIVPSRDAATLLPDQPNSWHLGPLECSLQASAARAATPAWSLKMAEQSASNESVSRSGVGKVSGETMTSLHTNTQATAWGSRGSSAVSGRNEHMDWLEVSNPSHHLMTICYSFDSKCIKKRVLPVHT